MASRNPADRGFVMPAEWSNHAATFLSWPHNKKTWPHNLRQAQVEFIRLVKAIQSCEPVYLLADQAFHHHIVQQFQSVCGDDSCPMLLDIPTNDAWIRDYGPSFVTDGIQLIAIDWHYNAWGGKYPPFDDDQKVTKRLLSHDFVFERFESSLCLEGGAIESDGQNVVMCTRSCALDPNRNLKSTVEVQAELKKCLGLQQIIWLPGDAIVGDDTDGHIDQLARFVPGNRILHAVAASSDSQFEALDHNRRALFSELKRLGLEYELIELPVPEPVFAFENRLPASYCNFYVCNGAVLVPMFDQPLDTAATEIISDCFPDRKVIGLPSIHLAVGLGSFHCLTQQMPQN